MSRAKRLVHRHFDIEKAADYYMWGFAIGTLAWLLRWVVLFLIVGRMAIPDDGIEGIFENAKHIVTSSDSIALVAIFAVEHTVLGIIKWLGWAYGLVGFAESRKIV